MLDAAQPVPGKKEQPDESRLEEEGHQAFNGQRCAEYIAYIVRIIRPVRAELEFHGDAGRDAHGEIDAEQHAPEFDKVTPDLPTSHYEHGFHDAEQNGETEC